MHYSQRCNLVHAAEIKSLQVEILRMQKELQYLQQWKRDVNAAINRKKQHRIKTCAKTSVAVQTECEKCVEVVTLPPHTFDDFLECSDDFEYV